MRILHAYLTRQVLAAVAMTVMVFTFVLLLGNVLREILNLLVNGQATLGLVIHAIGLLVPFVLVFALPMGLLTATLLVFGRFSADNELTAVRSSGVSLISLVGPVLLLAAAMSCVAAVINLEIAPRCRSAYRDLMFQAGRERSTALIVEDRFMDDFPGFVVYVGRKDGTNLHDVLLYKLDAEGRMESRFHAALARIVSIGVSNEVVLELNRVYQYDFLRWDTSYAESARTSLKFRSLGQSGRGQRLKDMTFFQLRDQQRELDRMIQFRAPPAGTEATVLRERRRQIESSRADLSMPIQVAIHRQLAFSFASIGFALVGIPLGIRAHRRETSIGIAIALILVSFYYGFIILGQALESRPEFAPHLILWIPNFLFQAVGAVLLWRANRGL